MPSEHSPGQSADRARFPEMKADLGEDPARWLDWDILGNRDRERLVRARIAAIDRIAVCRAWKAVERTLDRETRDGIIAHLDKREQQLEAIGERPDRLQERDGRDIPDKQWFRITEDGARIPWEDVDRSTAGASLRAGRRAVATDGGDQQ